MISELSSGAAAMSELRQLEVGRRHLWRVRQRKPFGLVVRGVARPAVVVFRGFVAAEDGAGANAPVGRSGNPIEIQPGTNKLGEVNGWEYSGRAFDRMRCRGIPPSAVDEAIDNAASVTAGRGGTTIYKSSDGVTVVVGSSGHMVTVW